MWVTPVDRTRFCRASTYAWNKSPVQGWTRAKALLEQHCGLGTVPWNSTLEQPPPTHTAGAVPSSQAPSHGVTLTIAVVWSAAMSHGTHRGGAPVCVVSDSPSSTARRGAPRGASPVGGQSHPPASPPPPFGLRCDRAATQRRRRCPGRGRRHGAAAASHHQGGGAAARARGWRPRSRSRAQAAPCACNCKHKPPPPPTVAGGHGGRL